MTYTPGEWSYSKLGNDADQWGIYDESGKTLGLSYHGEDNARLIAAAPDLLEALEWVLHDVTKSTEMHSLNSNTTAQVRAAIAKAKGGS